MSRRFVTHHAVYRGLGIGCGPFEPTTLCGRDVLLVDVTRYEHEVTCFFCIRQIAKSREIIKEAAKNELRRLST